VHGLRPGRRATVVETSELAEADRHLAAPVEGPPQRVGRGASPAPDGLSEDAPASDETPARPPRVHAVNCLRYLVYCALGLAALVGGVTMVSRYLEDRRLYVSTDNALVDGPLIQVGPSVAGRVRSVNVNVGDLVQSSQVVGTVDLGVVREVPLTGKPYLEYNGTKLEDVTAPISGVVVARDAHPGATLPAGATLVTIVDPRQLWVTANVEETFVRRVRPGQAVDVYVDSLGEHLDGEVMSVAQASAAVFSLAPPQNTTGNFTKIVQVQPVRIALKSLEPRLALGASVSVRIRAED
jgi:multidrug resistance efflux pump